MEMPPAAALPWIVLGAFSMLFQTTCAQGISPHSEQQAIFGDRRAASEATFDDRNRMTHGSPAVHSRNCLMRKQVYGWHPAWSGTAYQDYDFGLLSTVSYYSYEVDPETGGYHTLHQWRETKLVEMAHHFGTQVELTASLSGKGVQALLGNPTACTTLTDSLVALVKEKDADGVCIDFDGVTSANAKTFAGLVQLLAGKLRQWRNAVTVSVTLPGKDTDRGYDFPQLLPAVTRFIVKTYDARPSTSAIAGPLAPLHPGTVWGDGGFEKSLNDYLQAGVPRAKLLAGIPYFGYDWRTASDKPGAKTSGKARIVLLRDYEKMDSSAYLLWDTASTTGWLPRSSEGRSRQLWIDQVSSLTEKYAMVKQMDVAGVGIWALGYDHGSARYWNLLRGQFADCSATETDELARDSKPATPGLEGPTSAERNVWNWAWLLGGGLVAIAIIWAVKKYL
jgi:spore germination protein YaaH